MKDLGDNTIKILDFENISSWKNLSEEILLCERYSFEVTEAKLDELENWKKNKVFTEVDNKVQEIMSVRWVLLEETQKGVSKVKARLVARGLWLQERNFENLWLELALITL